MTPTKDGTSKQAKNKIQGMCLDPSERDKKKQFRRRAETRFMKELDIVTFIRKQIKVTLLLERVF